MSHFCSRGRGTSRRCRAPRRPRCRRRGSPGGGSSCLAPPPPCLRHPGDPWRLHTPGVSQRLSKHPTYPGSRALIWKVGVTRKVLKQNNLDNALLLNFLTRIWYQQENGIIHSLAVYDVQCSCCRSHKKLFTPSCPSSSPDVVLANADLLMNFNSEY